MSLAPNKEAPLGAGTGLEELLDGVSEFARAEIGARVAGPDVPLAAADLAAIETAAVHADLLDCGVDGSGLWAGADEIALFSVLTLRLIARHSTAAALHLHGVALARRAWETLTGEVPAAGTTLTLSGRLGLPGASLGRWLTAAALSADDHAVLADAYGTAPRIRWAATAEAGWIAPVYAPAPPAADGDVDAGTFELACFAGGGDVLAAAHGFDGLVAVSQAAGESAPREVAAPQLMRELIAAQQLGIVAIAQGAADTAVDLAREYASARRQGGQLIIGHDAVALMLADAAGAQRTAEVSLIGTLTGDHRLSDLAPVVELRRTALSALALAVDHAMQVHGGTGYMRDTGVENLWRDLNSLRVLAGTPDELGLLAATLRMPGAAHHHPGDLSGGDRIAGHLAPSAALALQPGFRRQPVLRAAAAYQAVDPWERDTRELPRPLRALRRELRDFATSHLAPIALEVDRAAHDSEARLPQVEAMMSAAGRAGLFGDMLPRPIGSAPAGRFAGSMVLPQVLKTEELAAADGGLMLQICAHNLGVAPVLFSGNRYALQNVLRPALRAAREGSPQVFAYAITEPGAGSDVEDGHGAEQSRPGLVAKRVAGGWQLTGNKVFISGGHIARWVVAFAALESEGFESWTAFLVDTESPGFSRLRNEHKMGMRASAATALAFDDCFVPDHLVLGGLRGGWGLNRATLNFSRLPVAAMAVGFARHATEIATQFACTEQLAGRPLLDRQYVQLALADMQAETAAIRSLVWQFSRRRVPQQAKASIAKFHATDRAQVVIERALGLLGELGLQHSFELEKVMRDNRLTRIFEGTNQINRLAVIEDQQDLLLATINRRH